MAWWDSRRRWTSVPSWSAPSPMQRKDRSIVHGISRHEHAPLEINGLTDGVLAPIVEEENLPVTDPALLINVSINFTDPMIRSQYHRSYASSHDFTPSERVCKGLLRRIEHCCEELITRKDSEALTMFTNDTSTLKRQRYEMTFQISRRGSGQWAERTFRSFQKQPLTVGLTKEVVLASDRMVALFLRQHDQGFRWLDGSVHDDYQDPQTATPSDGGPLSFCCIPEPRFNEATQCFDIVPGYTIMLSFRSRTQKPARTEFGKVVKVHSTQDTPLNLDLGEELLGYVSQCVQTYLETKSREFDEEHVGCEGVSDASGATVCSHLDDDAARVDLRVLNNLGPSYNHLQREFRSHFNIFRDENLQDCLRFVRHMEHEMLDARDQIDHEISQKDDFELRLLELRSPTWSISEPCNVRLDHWVTRPRRTIEAILDRVQTGISDVLHGNNLTVHLVAYKRGHLVMDKPLIARQARDSSRKRATITQLQQQELVARLRSRIRQDINKVCKDTCLLEEEAPGDDPFLDATGLHYVSEELPAEEPDVGHILGDTIQLTPKLAPLRSLRRTFSMMARPVSRRASKPEIKVDVDLDRQRSGSRPTTPSTPARSIHSSYTGTGSPRAFPLMPARYPVHSPSSHIATPATEISRTVESGSTFDRPGSNLAPDDVASSSGFQGLECIVLQDPAIATALHQDIDRHRAFCEISQPGLSRGSHPAHWTDSVEPHPTTRAMPPGPGPLPDVLGSAASFLQNADTAAAQPAEASSEWESWPDGTTYGNEDVVVKACGSAGKDNLRKALSTNHTPEPPQPLAVQHGDRVRIRDAKAADIWLRKGLLSDDNVSNLMSSSTSRQGANGDPWPRHSILTTPSQDQIRSFTGHTIRDYVHKDLPLQAGSHDSQRRLLLHQETIDDTHGSQPYHPIGNPGLDDERTPSLENRNIALEGGQETGPDTNEVHVEKHHTLLVAAEWVDGLEDSDEEPNQEEHSATLKDTIESVTTPDREKDRVMVDMLPISALSVAEISSEELSSKGDEVAIEHDRCTVAPRGSDDRGPIISAHAVKESECALPTQTTESCPLLCHEPVVTHPQLPKNLADEDGSSISGDSIFATEGSISDPSDVTCVHKEATITDRDAEVDNSLTLIDESSAASSTETGLGPAESPVSPPQPISTRTTVDGALVVEDIQLANQDDLTSLLLVSNTIIDNRNVSAGKEGLTEGEKETVTEHPQQTPSRELVVMPEGQVAASTDLASSHMLPVNEDDRVSMPLSLVEGLSKQMVEPAEDVSAVTDHDPGVTELTTSMALCTTEGCLEFPVARGKNIPFSQRAETDEKLAKAKGRSPVRVSGNSTFVAKNEGSRAAVEAVKYGPAIAQGFDEASAAAGGAPACDELLIVSGTEAEPGTTPKEAGEPVLTDERIIEDSLATAEERFVPANSMELASPEESLAAAVYESAVFDATTAVGEATSARVETAPPSDDAAILEDVAALREIIPVEQLPSLDRVEKEPAKVTSPDMTGIAKVENDKIVEPEISRKEDPLTEEASFEDEVTRNYTLPVEEGHAAPRAAAKGTSREPANTAEVTLCLEDEEQCLVFEAGVAEEQTVPRVQDIVLESSEARLATEDVEPKIENSANEAPSVVEEEVGTAPEYAATYDEAGEAVSAEMGLVGQAAEAQPPENELASAGLLIIEPVLAEEEISPSGQSGTGPEVVTESSLKEPAAEGAGPAIAEDSSPEEEVTTPTSLEQMPFAEVNEDAIGCLTQVQDLSIDQPQQSPETQADGMGWESPASAVEESGQPFGNSCLPDAVMKNEGLQAALVKDPGVYPHDPTSVQLLSSCALPRIEINSFPDRGVESPTESQVLAISDPSSTPTEPEAAKQEGAEGVLSAEPGERPPNGGRQMDLDNQDEPGCATVQLRDVQHDEAREVEKTPENGPTTESVAEPAQDVTPNPVLTVNADPPKDEPLAEPHLTAADEPITMTAVEPLAETALIMVQKSSLGPVSVPVTGSVEEAALAAEEAAHMTEPGPEVLVTRPNLEFGWGIEIVGKFPREEAPRHIVEGLLQEEATPETAFASDGGVPEGEPGPEPPDDAADGSCAGEARVELPVLDGAASEDELEAAVRLARNEVVHRREISDKSASERTGKTWRSEAVELLKCLETLPPKNKERHLDLRTPGPTLSCRQCSTESKPGEDGFQKGLEIPGTSPKSSASEGVDFYRSPSMREKEADLDLKAAAQRAELYSSQTGRTQVSAVPELALADTVRVTEPAAPSSCEPQAVLSPLGKDVPTATLMGHAALSAFEQEDRVLDDLGRNELHHLMDAQCIDLVPTKRLKLPNSGVEESLVDAKTRAMNADEPFTPTHFISQQLGETETTQLGRSVLALLTEELDQQTLTSETAQSGTTPQEASRPFDDSRPGFDPMATLKVRQLQKLYASEEANRSWARSASTPCDTAIFTPSDHFTLASTFPSHSHASVESASSHASSFVSERDSVDTYAPSLEGDLPEPAAEPEREYRPQTAGWLGLHRPVQRPRRFSMPLQYLREHSIMFDTSNRPGTADSTSTVKPSRRKGGQETPVPASSPAAIVPSETAPRASEKRSVVPRMVILLAGVAIAGKMMNTRRH